MIKKIQIIYFVIINLFFLKIKKVPIEKKIRLRGPVSLKIVTSGKLVIGDRSIIAAGSVVVNSIPNDEIWDGNPARFIRKINA